VSEAVAAAWDVPETGTCVLYRQLVYPIGAKNQI
jgi:hypothetical protein